jgi:Ser/Thr protein kinase RdoA (MazF antagonist)
VSEVEAALPNLGLILEAGWGIVPRAVHTVHARWFTGKVLARCDADDGSWCLAGSPAADGRRVAISANFHARLQEASCRVLSTIRATRAGDFLHQDGTHVWTLTSWEEGTPEHEHAIWTGSMLEQLGRAVGELHRLGRRFVPEGAVLQRPPTNWAGDWTGFDQWAARRWDTLMSDSEVTTAPDLEPLRSCIAIGLDVLPTLGAPRIRNLTIAHDDLWTEHVLFSRDGQLAAIIDLDGLDIGDGHGDLSALLSDFANLEPERCAQVIHGYSSEIDLSDEDLAAARATTIRHHLLVLMERIRLWQVRHDRRADLISPTRYWQRSIRTAAALNADSWVSAVLKAEQLT